MSASSRAGRASAAGRARRPLHLADSSRRAADHVNAVVRDLVHALRGRRRPSRLRALPERHASTTAARRFGEFRAAVRPRCPRRVDARSTRDEADDPLAYPDALSRRVAGLSRRADDGADGGVCTPRSRRSGRRRSSRVAAAPDMQEASRPPAAGLGRLACRRASSTPSARWPTRPSRRDSPSRSPPRATPRATRAVWAGIGAYRLPPAQTDREHRDRAPARRRRHHPLLVRQPDRSAPVVARLSRARRTRGVRAGRAAAADRHA